jgi:hypothetical protein
MSWDNALKNLPIIADGRRSPATRRTEGRRPVSPQRPSGNNAGVKVKAKLAAWTGIAAAALAAGSCTTIGGRPVEGWPVLQTYEHYVPHAEFRDRCSRYTSFGATALACAEFNFRTRRCDIWFSKDFPPQDYTIEHEREHCLGYEHAGESDLRNMLKRYNDSLAKTRQAGR